MNFYVDGCRGSRASSVVNKKESTCNAGDTGDAGLIPGSGTCPGGGNGNPLQYSYWENPMDSGTWWAAVHGVAKSNVTEHAWRETKSDPF